MLIDDLTPQEQEVADRMSGSIVGFEFWNFLHVYMPEGCQHERVVQYLGANDPTVERRYRTYGLQYKRYDLRIEADRAALVTLLMEHSGKAA